jgi:ATP-binding cassette subfamily B protein
VRWNGVPVTSDEQLHPPRCGFASQVPGVVSASIRDNVALGREVTDDDIRRALVRAQFDAEVAAMPAGLDTVVGPRGSKLSGGQLQRLALARMLVRECDLYVVDDTTSAIDVATERGLWRALLPGSPAAWLVASQRPEVLRYADQVIVLDAGRVVAAGTAEELARTNDFVQALSSSV